MKTMIVHPQFTTAFLAGSGEVEFLRLEVAKPLVGQTVATLTMPGESLVSALVRRGKAMIPATDTRLEAGDLLHLAMLATAIPKLKRLVAH